MSALLFRFQLSVVLFTIADAPAAREQLDATRMLDRAIVAAGGEKALAAATVLKWSAKATIHTSRGPLHIEGRWIVEPPDRAVVTTWETGTQSSSVRRMLLDVSRGWMERNGEKTAMPAATLANERDQFYLYSVMRLLPLRDPDVELSVIGPGSLLVRHTRRPDVEAFFDESGRLIRLRTHVSHPADNSDIVQEVTLAGTISSAGVQWPRTITIVQDGKPFFDMDLFEFALGTSDELTKAMATSSAPPSSAAPRRAS